MSARTILGTSLAVLMIAGCRSAEVQTPQNDIRAQPAPPDASMLPANTLLRAELNSTLSTRSSRVGERFSARVLDGIRAQNGEVMIPAGAVIHGTITALDPSEQQGDAALIRLNFESMEFQGRTFPFAAEVVDTEARLEGERRLARRGALRGAAAGAVLGAVLSRADLDDILKGAALGAGAGTVISLGTGDVDAALPAGTEMTLRTTTPIQLRAT